MECVVNALSTTEAVEVFKGVGGILHRGIVSPGQFVHVPLGAMILERTLGTNDVFGIQTICLPPAQSAVFTSFCNMVKQAKAVSDNPLTKFWTSVTEEIYKAK